jgi:nucleoid-associated protein YgaU
MTDTPSRMFLVLCLLVGVWIATYWLYQPRGPRITRDDRPPAREPIPAPTPAPTPEPRPQLQPPPQAPGPTSPATRRQQRVLPPEFDEIVVQRGDTSWEAIAARVYGDRRQWQAISRANPFVTPDRLFPGRTRLRIPRDPANIQGRLVEVDVPAQPPQPGDPPSPPSPTPPTPPGPDPEAQPPTVYVVQADDTLWSIARKVLGRGERWREILDLNRDLIPDPDRLPPGQKIRIPTSPAPSPGR